MLRKAGIILALMLTLPTFANAWTVTAKIGSGLGLVSDGTSVLVKGGSASVTGYYKSTAAAQTLTVAPAVGYAVSQVALDGTNITAFGVNGSYTINAGIPPKNHALVVYYTAVTNTISVTQPGNGVVTVQALDAAGTKAIGGISKTGISGLKAGAKVRITAAPNADYKVTDIAGGGVAGAHAGVPYTVDVNVTGNATYSAAFQLDSRVKVNLYAPSQSGEVGWPITVKAASISNDAVTYTYVATGGTIVANGLTATYTPTASGNNTVTVTATTAAGTTDSKTLKFNIISFDPPMVCTGCHYKRDTNFSTSLPHFNVYTALAANRTADNIPKAQFVSNNAKCTDCHGAAGHSSPGAKVASDYAASGHGDVAAGAWYHYDFKGRAPCLVCHSTNGFVQAFSNLSSGGYRASRTNYVPAGTATDGTKQVLGCNACHASEDWKNSIRTIGTGYVAGMGGFGTSAKVTISFPDVGESNVCIPCHASRENGASLKAAVNNTYAGSGFKNPHYLAAAAVFYGKGGFQFYTSGIRYNTYGAAGKVGKNANWSHGKLGMDNYSASGSNDVVGKSNNTGTRGQCVACHLGPDNTHTFGALETANATMAGTGKTRGCYGCHQGTDMDMASFIEEEKEIWNRLFDFFAWNLEQSGIYFNNDVGPYFFTAPYDKTPGGVNTSFSNWKVAVGGGTSDAQQTMGAAMNLKLLVAEKGSFVHNRSFGRALIADSIIYLQKGAVGDRIVVKADQNDIISFTAYSTARPASYPGQVGPDVSITTLKSYLTKTATGGWVRR